MKVQNLPSTLLLILFLSVIGLFAMERYDDKWDPTGRKQRHKIRELGYKYVDLKCEELGLFPQYAAKCLSVGRKCEWKPLCIGDNLLKLKHQKQKEDEVALKKDLSDSCGDTYYGCMTKEQIEKEEAIFEKCRNETAHLEGITLPDGMPKRQLEWNDCIQRSHAASKP